MDESGYMRSAEEYMSRLEEMAKKDLFDPSQYTFDANIKYLDSLIKMSKECSLKGNLEDGYIGFRRFQIVLSCLQQHNLYDPEDPHLKQLNMRSRQIQIVVNKIRQSIENKVNASNASVTNTRSVYHSTRESTSPLRKSDVSRCDSVDGGTRTLSHSFSQSSTSFPPVELTKSSSAEIRLSASVPVSPVPSLQAAKNYKLEYIKANMDLIPDVRGVPMHVGLPLPDDELESLLQLDDE